MKANPTLATRFSIQEFTNGSGSLSYRVSGIRRDGTRIRQNYASLDAAQCRQNELELEYLGGHRDVAVRATVLTEEQIRLAEVAFIKLDGAEGEIVDAVAYWLKHGRHSKVKASSKLDDAVETFKAWLDGDGKDLLRDRTRANLKFRVSMFANSVGNLRMDAITPEIVERYLEGRDVSPATKDNDRRVLSRFFKWCMKRPRGWMAHNPARDVTVDQPSNGHPPAILTVPECERLLRAAEKFEKGKLAPYFATCLFGGLRPFEVSRLTWAQVNMEDGEIRLEANQTKTGRARVVGINATLRAWLKRYEGRPFFPSNWRKDFDTVKEQAGFGTIYDLDNLERKHLKPWAPDVMRHTAISHYFRSCGSYGLTAERHGNSENIIKAHYQGRVSTEDTKAFYAIMPTAKKGAK